MPDPTHKRGQSAQEAAKAFTTKEQNKAQPPLKQDAQAQKGQKKKAS